MSRTPLSSVNPLFYRLSVFLRRQHRRMKWCFGREKYALEKSADTLAETIIIHKSILMRKLQGIDQSLQKNKIVSLKIASSRIDGVIINPGQVFSFWKLVGNPAVRRGFLPGLQLSFGELKSMAGGGLCQLSNLLHWMVLQSPMEVVERHRHDTDPFPDYRRTVPFGTGATVFYNYLDFVFKNNTPWRFQLKTRVDEEYLQGEIRCNKPLSFRFSVEERNHRFVRIGETVYRENELWRIKTDLVTSDILLEELLMKNHSRVLYDVSEVSGIQIVEQK